MRNQLKLFLSVSILAGLVACGGSPTIESDLGVKGAPDWVNEGTQSVDSDDGRYIYGVAFAPPMNDSSLQTATADNRARAELARTVSTYVSSTLSDYSASSGNAASTSIEQNITSATQTLLNGSKIKGRWLDKHSGNIYSFAEMDMESLDDSIAAADKLSPEFKKFYSENSSANFQRFVTDK
ncbi:MAG: LPP20 family lipoprotein [Pseudomonadales bacterium]|nr:LPP20 family lipoprotein [Pseudomonadales bacterium]